MKSIKVGLFVLIIAMLVSTCAINTIKPTSIPTLAPTLTATHPPSTLTLKPTAFPPTLTAIPIQTLLPKIERDVTYCTMNGVALKMDIYAPQTTNNPLPVVVRVHGGLWTGGDKAEDGDIATAWNNFGFIAVNVNYRLAPQYKFPAMIEDIKCAVRFLRAHAVEYNLDPDRIGALGNGAGGHLVALLGLTDKSAGWDVGEYLDQSSSVQAVVDNSGPTDLTDLAISHTLDSILIETFGTANPNSLFLAKASPANYVRPNAPPFFISHGNLDKTIPIEQSQKLYESLIANSDTATFIIIKNGGDGKIMSPTPTSPSTDELWQMTLRFIQQYLQFNGQ